jgi:hypothetical protein
VILGFLTARTTGAVRSKRMHSYQPSHAEYRIMAKAKQEGGLYYTADGTPVDADGNVLKDAPKRGKDTDPSKQPGALGAPTPEERMGRAIADAITGKKPASAAAVAEEEDATDDDEVDGLPTLADLPDHLAGIESVDEVKALRKTDKRKGAKPIYEARLAELEGE